MNYLSFSSFTKLQFNGFFQYYDLAADVLAENAHLTYKYLTPVSKKKNIHWLSCRSWKNKEIKNIAIVKTINVLIAHLHRSYSTTFYFLYAIWLVLHMVSINLIMQFHDQLRASEWFFHICCKRNMFLCCHCENII